MARPTLTPSIRTVRKYGIIIGLFPVDTPGYGYEIERAPDNAGAPNTALSEFFYQPEGSQFFTDYDLPNDGLKRWYRVRHVRDGYSKSAPTCWVSAKPAEISGLIYGAPDAVVPIVQEATSETATTGTLTLTILDPQCRIVTVEMRIKSGTGNWGVWTAVTSPYTANVTLVDKHASRIGYRITYYDAVGSLRIAQEEVAFNVGTAANVTGVQVAFAQDGSVAVSVQGDSDAAKHYVKVGIGSAPADPTTSVNDGLINSRAGSVQTTVVCPKGSIAYVKVLPMTSASAAGSVALFQAKNEGVAPGINPSVRLNTSRDKADVYGQVEAPGSESARVFYQENETTSEIWASCTGNGNPAPLYLADGTSAGPTTWFCRTSGGSTVYAQMMNQIPLVRDQVKRAYLQVQGQLSGIRSSWSPVTLSAKESPWLESVDLVFDEANNRLRVTVVGGAFCGSCKIELSADSFSTIASTSQQNLTDGQQITYDFGNPTRGITWNVRVMPYNSGLVGGNVPTSGAGAAYSRDSVLVPAALTIDPPTANISFVFTAGYDYATKAKVQYEGALGAGGTGPLQWRRRIDVDSTQGTWSAFASTALPSQEDVLKHAYYPTKVYLEVKDSAGRTTAYNVTIPARSPETGYDVTEDVNKGALLWNFDALPRDSRLRLTPNASYPAYSLRDQQGISGGALGIDVPTTNLVPDPTNIAVYPGAIMTRTLETDGEFAGWYKVVVSQVGAAGLVAALGAQLAHPSGNLRTYSMELFSPSGKWKPLLTGDYGVGVAAEISPRWWSLTWNNTSGATRNIGFYMQYDSGNTASAAVNEVFWYRNVQTEALAFPTAFVQGSRTARGMLVFDDARSNNWDEFTFLCRAKVNPGVPLNYNMYGAVWPKFYLAAAVNTTSTQITVQWTTGGVQNGAVFTRPNGGTCYDQHAFAISYKRSTQAGRVYYNGQLLGTFSANWDSTATQLTLGNLGPGQGYEFNGLLEDVFVAPRVLADEEVAAMHSTLIPLVDLRSLNTGAVRAIQGLDLTGLVQAGKVVTTSITDGAITTPKILAGAVTADRISVATLSAISANVGTLTAGLIRNPGLTAGLRLSSAYSLGGLAKYIDLDDSASGYFIYTPNFQVASGGAVTISGTVTASAFTSNAAMSQFSNSVRVGLSLYADNMKIASYGYFGTQLIVGQNETTVSPNRMEMLTTRVDFIAGSANVGSLDWSSAGLLLDVDRQALRDYRTSAPNPGAIGSGQAQRLWFSELSYLGLSGYGYGATWQIDQWTSDSGGGSHQQAWTSNLNGAWKYRTGTRAGGWGSWFDVARVKWSTSAASGTAPHGTIWIQHS
jgi:hypothetical protein